MKNFKFLAALCCMLAVFTACEKDNINGNSGNDNATGNNNHEYVDLGLPSGTKWATCNVGASSPEKYGDYFAWGETEPKTTYSWDTYKWYNGSSSTFTKYNTISDCGIVDDKIVLDPEDDAATINWGSKWRMPTETEWMELLNNCTWTWKTMNGINGYEVKGSNGNSIFLPAAGSRNDSNYEDGYEDGEIGNYWSSSLYCSPSSAMDMWFDTDRMLSLSEGCYRSGGKSVRPILKSIDADNSNESVSVPTGTENGYGYVDLGLSVKWATCNIGATKPEEYGNYYAWGETEPKSEYNWGIYKWATATQEEWGFWYLETLTKYNTDANYGTVDNKIVLDLEDDAASVNWGGAWRMPTKEEYEELLDNCTLKWVYSYKGTGVAGRIVKSKINGNSIFLPAAGRCGREGRYNLVGEYGGYWASSLYADYPNSAWDVFFLSDDMSSEVDCYMFIGGEIERFCGQSVRPVLK